MKQSRMTKRVARALGASYTARVGPMEHTPFGMFALADRVRRLRSTGPEGSGRPGDPRATVPRLVKFKPSVWRKLDRVARSQARVTGRHVSPAQVAAMVIEEALRQGLAH